MLRADSLLRRFWRLEGAEKKLALEAVAMLTWACVVVRWRPRTLVGRYLRRLEGAEKLEDAGSRGDTETQRRTEVHGDFDAQVRLAAKSGTREGEHRENKSRTRDEMAACFRGAHLPARRPAKQADQANAPGLQRLAHRSSASLRLCVEPFLPSPPLSPLRLLEIMDRVARTHPLRPLCLERALAGRWLLARHGHASTLVIGVKAPVFEAHAWLEVRDGVDTRVTSNAGYQPIWRA